MQFGLSDEQRLIVDTVRSFVEQEIDPHEAEVERSGRVPPELGRQIERRAMEAGLYAANLPESVGGGGLDYRSMALVEREYGKTSHALHAWIGRPTELLLACDGEQREKYLHRIADGDPHHAFVAIAVRIGPGRSADEKTSFVHSLLGAAERQVAGEAGPLAIAWSVELAQIDPAFRVNHNEVRDRIATNGRGGHK